MPARNRLDVDGRRVRVAALLLERKTVRDIARALSIGKSTAHRDVEAVQAEWRAQRDRLADAWLAEELARLAAAEGAIWRRVAKGQLTALDRELAILERRSRYLGLDAPEKRELLGEGLVRIYEDGRGHADPEPDERGAAG